MKILYTYNKNEADKIAKYFENKGETVSILPIAEEFRKVGDARPVKIKYYIKIGAFSGIIK